MRLQSPKPALLDVEAHGMSAPVPAGPAKRRYVAFVIDGGTSQITRYTVEATGAREARVRLEGMGLLVRQVLPRWAYWSLVVLLVAAGVAALWGATWVVRVIF